ncbi:hypothetical protein NIES4071_75120 [Calothrix sp. NIES-4071]|nr:hypothetical protein NIES4071_75120 [Calothrix sp. NIES-4071]BAZ61787.1 hypothetical protein NIES4105_75070 [Calothrix sp. NIES-4105]
MAKSDEVKKYLAYWFQLGKGVVINNGTATLLPGKIFAVSGYSSEFEECWQKIIEAPSSYHLEGTHETIAELLGSQWSIESCARCDMPVPMRHMGMPATACPCFDLATWPNTEVPSPRGPVNSQEKLLSIRNRLMKS